ncbi:MULTISPECIES: fluoride efflux transporter CrcB [Brevibacillus]|uniref:fluoride efflux transporter CrcB n=1 Tax=Brevibacillus TaxID=55080 RepID=UPI002380A435|nr:MULTISPECIES: fluoride efflux transporter CrcB [Brevibacillus]MDH6350120.1 CrcB protein [Brevibacillus sp. 1238]WDV93099.1 fluoride efflux transporter CrcB [Brevibacillus parabrevis]
MAWVAVAVGGAVGSLFRYWLSLAANQPGWPIGTWLANIIGSFLIGVLFVIGKERGGISPEAYILFTTGVMGGFTTFSTFSLEVVSFWGDGQWLRGTLYALASIVVGLSSCAVGIWLARQMQ